MIETYNYKLGVLVNIGSIVNIAEFSYRLVTPNVN